MPAESARIVTPALLRELPLPEPGADKNANGRLLVVGGSVRSPGAVRLSGEAALRSGAGKVSLATVEPVLAGLGPLVPEAALVPLPTDRAGAIDLDEIDQVVAETDGADVVLAGPGLMDPEHAVALLTRLVRDLDAVLVVDGLASAFLTEDPDGLHHLGGRAVLTANPVELARTAHLAVEDVERDPVAAAVRVARECRVVVVCGGTAKHIATPEGETWLVEGGSRGLAASGSGDVHAGIVAGLLARGADPVRAAIWGAYIHARCGERLAASIGTVGFLARELPGEIPAVLRELD